MRNFLLSLPVSASLVIMATSTFAMWSPNQDEDLTNGSVQVKNSSSSLQEEADLPGSDFLSEDLYCYLSSFLRPTDLNVVFQANKKFYSRENNRRICLRGKNLNDLFFLAYPNPLKITSLDLSETQNIILGAFSHFKNLTHLNLMDKLGARKLHITNETLAPLTSLKVLRLAWIRGVTTISHLTNLTKLDLAGRWFRDNAQITSLTNLTELRMRHCSSYSNDLLPLPKLTCLKLADNYLLTLDFARHSTLTSLGLDGDSKISNCDSAYVSNIRSLSLRAPRCISNENIVYFSNLTKLTLASNRWISEAGLSPLTNLTSLKILNNNTIKTIPVLPSLKSLSLSRSRAIQRTSVHSMPLTTLDLSHLTTLTSLDLSRSHEVNDESVAPLTNLTFLNLFMNPVITAKACSTLSNLNYVKLDKDSEVTVDQLSHLKNLRVEYLN